MDHRATTATLAWALVLSLTGATTEPAFAAERSVTPFAAFVPAPEHKADPGLAPHLEGQTWTDETPDYVIRAQRIDGDQRIAYIEHIAEVRTDPFAMPRGAVNYYESFVVEVRNTSDTAISFNPGGAWLTADKAKDLRTPYGLDELSFEYRAAGLSMPPAYRHAAKALLQYPVFVEPGESVAGLLVYRGVEKKTRRMQLELSLVLASGDTVSFRAPYRRLSKKELAAAASN